MLIRPATLADLPAIVDLANSAYRGETSRQGWTTEADYIEGQRTDLATLTQDLADQPLAVMLTLRDDADGPIIGSVWLEPAEAGVWYLGLLTVRPDLQGRQLGRAVLQAAEAHAAEQGASRIRMTVVAIRDTLIAWYERRGYGVTGETRPFPYGDTRFGEPQRDDLSFVVLEKAL